MPKLGFCYNNLDFLASMLAIHKAWILLKSKLRSVYVDHPRNHAVFA